MTDTGTQEHTPVPWELGCVDLQAKGGDSISTVIKCVEGGTVGIAACRLLDTFHGARSMTAQEVEANARFIVKAVNLHDELVAACRRALKWLPRPTSSPPTTQIEVCEDGDFIRDMLAKAEKEGT